MRYLYTYTIREEKQEGSKPRPPFSGRKYIAGNVLEALGVKTKDPALTYEREGVIQGLAIPQEVWTSNTGRRFICSEVARKVVKG